MTSGGREPDRGCTVLHNAVELTPSQRNPDMTVTVVIPAYNCASTIRETLDSVFAQTSAPDEILVVDDGSTDRTFSVVESYKPKVVCLRQSNQGLAASRNRLISRASCDIVAFLDSDDLWHPRYLEMQRRLWSGYPEAAAFFTAHETFGASPGVRWTGAAMSPAAANDVMSPLEFLGRYAASPGPFLPSFCSVPRRILDRMVEPFRLRIAEDVYFFNLLALEGRAFVYCPAVLGAYRLREGSLSSNRLLLNEGEVLAFEVVEPHYRAGSDIEMRRVFGRAYAAKRRLLAKTLMGVGKRAEARFQLRRSIRECPDTLSIAKSIGWLASSYMPKALQPARPSGGRQMVARSQE